MHSGWRGRRVLRRWLRPWRRSLLLRVMTTTVLLGALTSFALGSFMYQRIADGLVAAKMRSSEQDAAQRRTDAERKIASTIRVDPSTMQQLGQDIVDQTAAPGEDRSRLAILTLAKTPGETNDALPAMFTPPYVQESWIPESIRDALDADPEHQQAMTIRVSGQDEGSPTNIPAVVIGSQLRLQQAGNYDLYIIYPMQTETRTLALIKNAFILGGLGLVLLLAALAYMVTRMVVTPVRSARHVAERLSEGALNERMVAQGEDDLARLATSFNAMADNLQRQIRQLEDLSEVQQRFTSDVSHELRTPLTTIRMAADLIHQSRSDFSAPVSRSAELLLRELDRFESLLADLLEISRFDAGAASLELEQADLRDVVRRVIDSTATLASRAGTVVMVEAPAPCRADMDQRRVERVIRNLVSNAIEHAEQRPIDITVGANDTAVAVSVRDHGVGLKPGEASMVFNRFWRSDPARARTTGGTGLGLSISLEDARLHQGWLQAWGEPGEGSCFRLTLPLRPGDAIKRSPTRLVDVAPTATADPSTLVIPAATDRVDR
ncbi:histidine kinase [Luteipulveratus mongoliensis]|uniref:Sensor histidine kinase MtrB n=2 Tax=Luteipulveratus mongoliensis TaxID=571913 RepID=A0A0K1JQ31_9MICO|nr:histidine kinase [Luteipulveratus mongoliensis]